MEATSPSLAGPPALTLHPDEGAFSWHTDAPETASHEYPAGQAEVGEQLSVQYMLLPVPVQRSDAHSDEVSQKEPNASALGSSGVCAIALKAWRITSLNAPTWE
jgi:hypothetical protein